MFVGRKSDRTVRLDQDVNGPYSTNEVDASSRASCQSDSTKDVEFYVQLGWNKSYLMDGQTPEATLTGAMGGSSVVFS